MSWAILLFIGFLLIFLEFYLPGGIIGAAGAVALITSLFLFAKAHTWSSFVLLLVAVIMALILLIRFALWRIVHAPPERSIYLNKDQQGYLASTFDVAAIGKKGVVSSDLKPGGYIHINGKRQQAISIVGYLEKGTEVIVIGGQEESLIVKPFSGEI